MDVTAVQDFKDFVSHLETYQVNPDTGTEERLAAEQDGYVTSVDTLAPIEDSQVLSSRRKERAQGTFLADRHDVVIDIDLPAMLLPSATPGHHHLIVKLPGAGADPMAYQRFLDAAAGIGLIEAGYARVAEKRGHTDVRLPWIGKGDARDPFPVVDTREA